VIAGALNKQIAAELGVSEVTVKVHRANAMRKMRAKSLPELIHAEGRLSGEPIELEKFKAPGGCEPSLSPIPRSSEQIYA
jgi:hypothetical protein